MSVAGTQEQRDLAASVSAFAADTAPTSWTRDHLEELGAGDRTPAWERVVEQGLHAIHLAEEDGERATLADLAVVVEELGRALYPGPALPTLLLGATLSAPSTPAGREVFDLLADGAIGALVDGAGVVATPAGDGWVLDGTTAPTLGLPGADVVVVRLTTGSGAELWCRVDGCAGAGATALTGVDRTRSVGRLVLDGCAVPAGRVLPTPDAAHRELVAATLYGAEADGLSRWLLDTAVEYARSRKQFGRPIGSFQAIQHRLALMLVRAETASATVWDAARADTADEHQQRLAAAQAALVAPAAAVDVALDCVGVLGAIGFTWEHDAQLYYRRALSLAAAAGPEASWARRLGELAGTGRRDFSLVREDTLPELRARIGPALDEAAALPDDDGLMTGWGPVRGGRRRAVLAEAALVAPHYPAPYGLDAGPVEQAVIAEEFDRRDLVRPTTVIGEWVLPTLLAHGTEEQRERFVGPTLRGEIVWCQLFSEPGAGSDLAGLTTRAERVDGGWRLYGQKVWNSYAHVADYGVCLARSEPEGNRHQGISYFIVDMRAPGIEVRPIRQATGRAEFNEVFLDGVFVPDECLVGPAGEGWRLAATTLANERLNMGAAFGHGSADLLRRAISDGAVGVDRDEALRVLGRCVSREQALSALALRGTLARLAGLDPGPSVSVQKVYNAMAQRDGSREIVALLGPVGLVDEPDVPYADDHLGLPAILFGGGTVEVQLNLIARRVLGLPGEPRPERTGS